MAENQPKTKRELAMERLKGKYPDKEFADDEAMYGQINDDYDEYDRQLGEYKDRESKLTDLFAKDPRNADFITQMAKGDDPFVRVIERLGIDGITDLINDPEKREIYAEANKTYIERQAKEKELKDEFEKNIAESSALFDKIQQERGLSDDQINAAFELLISISNDAVVGKFTPESIDMALKAVNHDSDMEAARAEGNVAGRNARIDERLRTPKTGDGMPSLGGSSNAPVQNSKPKSVFDLAGEAR